VPVVVTVVRQENTHTACVTSEKRERASVHVLRDERESERATWQMRDADNVDGEEMAPEEHGGFSEATLAARDKHAAMLERLQQKWAARQLAVPTNDRLVQLRLRELDEPIILFGEPPGDRRERLRDVLIRRGIDQALPACELERIKAAEAAAAEEDALDAEGVSRFVDSGNERLRKTRQWLLHYSLQRARERIAQQQRERDDDDDDAAAEARDKAADIAYARAQRWTSATSQIGDERPLSACALSADGTLVLTGAWSGIARLWRTADCECAQTFRGHTDRVLGVAFHPTATHVATASADGNVMIWNMDSAVPCATLRNASSATAAAAAATTPAGPAPRSAGWTKES